jgi:hypothetical protein
MKPISQEILLSRCGAVLIAAAHLTIERKTYGPTYYLSFVFCGVRCDAQTRRHDADFIKNFLGIAFVKDDPPTPSRAPILSQSIF